MPGARELAHVALPTRFGEFQVRAFEVHSGVVYLALAKGELTNGSAALTRLHTECLIGDALGSLRCDCGARLRCALRRIADEGRGLLLYATGPEGRGAALVDRLVGQLRATVEPPAEPDSVLAARSVPGGNGAWSGAPVDGVDDVVAVLRALGVEAVRLLSDSQDTVRGLREAGITVESTEPLRAVPAPRAPVETAELLGAVDPRADRPYVVLKYAQTLDGRIATGIGDSKWISGEEERGVSHALRAACDAVLVGVGTVLRDDPRLTVRLVPGRSPLRVVLDSTLRTPSSALLLGDDAVTVVLTTDRAAECDRQRLRAGGAKIRVLPAGPGGVDLVAGLRALRAGGVRSLLVEGGARVITSLLRAGLVDRVVVGTAPKIIGAGTEAVGDLGIARVAEGIALRNRVVHLTGDDVLTAWDVC